MATNETVNFEALDVCHQQIAAHLSRLGRLIKQINSAGIDDHARHEAGAIESFFSGTSRAHHAEEEKSVFPPLLNSGNAKLEAAVRSLQQDHGWIEENWLELAPQLRAIALGNTWLDAAEFLHYAEVFLDLCRERDDVFPDIDPRWWAKVQYPAV